MAVLFSLCSDDWMFIGRHNVYVFPERGYPYYTRQNALASENSDSMATSRITGGTVSGLLPFEQSMVLCLIGPYRPRTEGNCLSLPRDAALVSRSMRSILSSNVSERSVILSHWRKVYRSTFSSLLIS